MLYTAVVVAFMPTLFNSKCFYSFASYHMQQQYVCPVGCPLPVPLPRILFCCLWLRLAESETIRQMSDYHLIKTHSVRTAPPKKWCCISVPCLEVSCPQGPSVLTISSIVWPQLSPSTRGVNALLHRSIWTTNVHEATPKTYLKKKTDNKHPRGDTTNLKKIKIKNKK